MKTKTVKTATLKQFLDACRAKSDLDIYEFVDSRDGLLDLVYAEGERLGVNFDEESEPFRASCIAIGTHNGIQSLIDY